jgi:tripartite-type tricarboxylate transporter receptor subunit TctC
LVAPVGTRAEIIDRLSREVARIVAEPDVQERLTFIGFAPESDTPQEFGTMLKSEIERWAGVIRESGMQKVE